MEDQMVVNGEFSDGRTVEITGDEASSKISGLTQKISDLEREKEKIVRENAEHRQHVEELNTSVKELRAENVEFKKQVEKAKSENNILGLVATRAAELEGEMSRLQHDLVSAMSDLQESDAEVSDLKRNFEGMKEKEKEKNVKLEAIEKERDLLLSKVEKLEAVESNLREESEKKEKEVRSLKKNVEELEAVLGNGKNIEKLKNDLEKTIEKMKGEISNLESSLLEKEKVISGFEMKGRAIVDGVNGGISGNGFVEGGKKGLIGGLKHKDWMVVGGSTAAAVAVMGIVCYLRIARKH